MAKLVLSLNGAVQGEFELDQERFTIGRKPENEIQIDNLAVSGKHSMIITILDDSFLEDLGSTNGTYVNGKLVKKHALKDGDVIAIGKNELKYLNENASDDDEDEFEKNMIIKPGSAVAAAKAAEDASAAAAPTPQAGAPAARGMPLGRLTVLNGPIAGKELELTKALITLGKPGTQVAVISRRPQGYFLTHIESSGGFPVVNGAEIGAKAYQLKDSDTIELAGIKMEFSLS
jgi:pSer/pThr/pTyr-binding forkhead associated (FHA) protein